MRKRHFAAFAGTAVLTMVLTTACGSEGTEAFKPASDGSAADSEYGAGDSDGYGSDGYGSDGSDDSGYGGSEAGGDEGGDARTAPAKTLGVNSTKKLGPVVTDAKGWTLYRFDEDTADPPATNCEGDCAAAWPPVPAGDTAAADGIDSGKLGSVERADGSKQLTLDGWPVYRYAEDAAPGDTTGHGVSGTWFAFAPDGGKAGQQEQQQQQEQTQQDAQLQATDNAELGTILVDGKGRTLYRFDKDSAWPMKSNCTGDCLQTWKPAAPVDKDRVKGVPEKLVNSFTRPDGSKQLAIDCWLLYWFTGDTEPGDTNGQGSQGLWHAVGPTGKKIASE